MSMEENIKVPQAVISTVTGNNKLLFFLLKRTCPKVLPGQQNRADLLELR